METESAERLGHEVGMRAQAIGAVEARLSSEIRSRERRATRTGETLGVTAEVEYALPAEPTSPGELHIRARQFQSAARYNLWRVTLKVECDACRAPSYVQLSTFAHDGSMALRHVDYLSDGTERIVPTGVARQ